MRQLQKYRMRTPSTGRELIVQADPDTVYVDKETGEELEVIAELLPLAPTESELPWAIENLRFCNHCDQLAQKDLLDCPWCGARKDPACAEPLRRPARRQVAATHQQSSFAHISRDACSFGRCTGDR